MTDATDLQADLDNHRIEGYLPDGRNIDLPLISHIVGNLWTGGCIDGARLPEDFEYVISLYPWERYVLGPDTERFEFRQYDARGRVDEEAYDEIVDQAVSCVMAGKTLIHCQAGINRSSYTAARVLMQGGMTPDEAIRLLQTQRSPLVLANPDLRAHLFEIYERAGT